MTDCNHAHWQHDHDYRPLERRSERRAWMVAALTGATMLLEIGAGYLFNSMALLADGWHMASHMVAIGLTATAYLLARRYARDPRFAFGTWKVEVLAGFASALLLVMVALLMIGESLWRFWEPVVIRFDQALWVAVLGLGVNLLSALLLSDGHDHGHGHGHDHGHDHDHPHDHDHDHDHGHGHHGRDLNRHAAFIHVLTDALTSVAAIVALLGGKFFGWNWLDPAMGIIGGVVILVWAWGLLRETTFALLDRETNTPLVGRVRQAVEGVPDTEIVDFHLWRVGRAQYGCIVSVATHQPHTADQYKRALDGFPELVHVTAEVNRCRQLSVQCSAGGEG